MTTPDGERIVVVGSGPAAAGAVLALLKTRTRHITVLDIGSTLEPERRAAVETMAALPPQQWPSGALEIVRQQPAATSKGLPQKRTYGSDFPFRDLGQLRGLTYSGGANTSSISSAFGGFSNVWGAQVMPFSRATFDTWPLSFEQMAPHYTAILDEVPLAAEVDDLLDAFPLLTERAQPLPRLAPASEHVLSRYAEHRDLVRSHGVTVGRARLAVRAHECVHCGLCMTGCPYGLIYSASHTFDRLRREERVRYRAGLLVTGVGEDADGCFVRTRSVNDGRQDTLRADRIFVACGGIGSTRLVLGSLPGAPDSVLLSESLQFAVPFLSRRSTGDPRAQDNFTLNQFNILVSFDNADHHTSQVHCYPYNPAVIGALPGLLRGSSMSALTAQVLGRLTIGLGYLPSWASPPVGIRVHRRSHEQLPDLIIGQDAESRPLMLRQVMRRLLAVSRALDLFPLEAAMQLAAPGKSYHFGGSFPHRADTRQGVCTDVLGRPPGWSRIHLVDGAVLPSVPSTTFTLTVMANAHRIASEVGR